MKLQPRTRIILRALLFVSVVIFLALAFVKAYKQVPADQLHLHAGYLLLSLVFCLAFFFLQAIGWWWAVRKLGSPMPLAPALSTWFVSQIVKYVPGKVMLGLYRMVWAERVGVPKTRTVLSIMVELVLMVVSATLFFAALAPFLSRNLDDKYALYGVAFCCVAGLVVIHPRLLNFGVNFALRVFKKPSIVIDFSYGSLIWMLLYFLASWLFYAVAAVFNVMAVTGSLPGGFDFAAAVAAGFAISWVLGFLSFLTPGGMGVREAVLTVVLSPYLSVSVALIVAVVSRIIWMVGEVVGTGLMIHWRPRPLPDGDALEAQGE